RTCTGAWRISDGSQATPISSMGRSPWPPPASFMKASHLSRRRAPLENRRATQCEYLPYLTDCHPHVEESRTRRAEEVRLPLQAHDHCRRADRAGSLEMVLQLRWQRRGGNCRHLVADGKRRVP